MRNPFNRIIFLAAIAEGIGEGPLATELDCVARVVRSGTALTSAETGALNGVFNGYIWLIHLVKGSADEEDEM